MSPPEIWGPPVWTLFHTLIEKLNPNAYYQLSNSLFSIIVQICGVLPCPECSRDASNFLAGININNYKTKNEFKNMLYLFHNFVNVKKRKPLYNYANMNKYENINIFYVINNFLDKYNTKGNMKLITESFQRTFVIKNFITWFGGNKFAFIKPNIPKPPKQIRTNIKINKSLKNTLPTIEEHSFVDSHDEKFKEVYPELSVEHFFTEEDIEIKQNVTSDENNNITDNSKNSNITKEIEKTDMTNEIDVTKETDMTNEIDVTNEIEKTDVTKETNMKNEIEKTDITTCNNDNASNVINDIIINEVCIATADSKTKNTTLTVLEI